MKHIITVFVQQKLKIDEEKFNFNQSYSFDLLGPEPAFGRLGLGGTSGGYSSHGRTSHASLRAYGAQLEGLASH